VTIVKLTKYMSRDIGEMERFMSRMLKGEVKFIELEGDQQGFKLNGKYVDDNSLFGIVSKEFTCHNQPVYSWKQWEIVK